jgi:hypothetical protein
MTRLRLIVRRVAHVGALLFCAWWLVATSAVHEDPRECFTGLGDTARIQVLLGPSERAADSGVSCAGLDGVTEGSLLVLDLTRAEARESCIGYMTQSVSGGSGIAGTPQIVEPTGGGFTSMHSDFTSPTQPTCKGTWYFRMSPATLPPEGQLVSPLDAGAAQPWYLERFLFTYPANCGLPDRNAWAACGDRFVVQSITEIAQP